MTEKMPFRGVQSASFWTERRCMRAPLQTVLVKSPCPLKQTDILVTGTHLRIAVISPATDTAPSAATAEVKVVIDLRHVADASQANIKLPHNL